MGTRGGTRVGDWLLERVLGWFLPRWVSLPLLNASDGPGGEPAKKGGVDGDGSA